MDAMIIIHVYQNVSMEHYDFKNMRMIIMSMTHVLQEGAASTFYQCQYSVHALHYLLLVLRLRPCVTNISSIFTKVIFKKFLKIKLVSIKLPGYFAGTSWKRTIFAPVLTPIYLESGYCLVALMKLSNFTLEWGFLAWVISGGSGKLAVNAKCHGQTHWV